MRKIIGLGGFLLALVIGTCAWELARTGSTNFLTPANIKNLLTWIGLFGILSLGQCLVIVTGGIDLSIGSLVGLIAVIAAMLMDKGQGYSPVVVLPFVLLIAAAVGLYQGLLITKLNIQPFVVTLCGLFFWRGIARVITEDVTQGFGNAHVNLRWLGRGTVWDQVRPAEQVEPGSAWQTVLHCVPAPFLILLVLLGGVGAYLHFSAQGRHLFALGANEEAARFSGIRTAPLKISAYILCGLLSGIGGLLLAFKVNSVQPKDFGSFYELYAIAGAVLGGCSLRGGSGNVVGVLLGAAIILVLRNMVNILGIPSQLEYVVIGGAILAGVCIDELLTRRAASRSRTVVNTEFPGPQPG